MGNHPKSISSITTPVCFPLRPRKGSPGEAQKQPRCGGTEGMLIGQHDEEHHSQRPKVTLQTWQKVFQKAAAAWLGANHLPLTFYLFIYPSILTIHPSIGCLCICTYFCLSCLSAHIRHTQRSKLGSHSGSSDLDSSTPSLAGRTRSEFILNWFTQAELRQFGDSYPTNHLVGGWNKSLGMIIPNIYIWENEKCSKPPISHYSVTSQWGR